MSKNTSKKAVSSAVVLGGGGSHGFAHIGVLKELQERNISIRAIASCSIGSFVGVCVAAGKTVEEIEHHFLHENSYFLFRPSLKRGLFSNEKIVDDILAFAGVKKFSDLKIPLMVNATDVNTGKEVVFSSGDLKIALMASSAVPGFFSCIRYKRTFLFDGGFSTHLPVHLLNRYKNIVAVDVFSGLAKISKNSHPSLIIQNASIIPQRKLAQESLRMYKGDLTLVKPNVKNMQFFDLSHKDMKRCIRLGHMAAKKAFEGK